jgi:hypothetical protein
VAGMPGRRARLKYLLSGFVTLRPEWPGAEVKSPGSGLFIRSDCGQADVVSLLRPKCMTGFCGHKFLKEWAIGPFFVSAG